MKKLLLFCIFFHLNYTFIDAQSKYPADISFLLTDFKYSKKHGLKICEVQHGSLSVMNGDRLTAGGDGIIPPAFASFFNRFSVKKWATGLGYAPIKKSLLQEAWCVDQPLQKIIQSSDFLELARLQPANPYSLDAYSGIIYADKDIVNKCNFYQRSYPGILFMNAAILPYWKDKYKMNSLFNLNDELKQYKADWRLYPKKYDDQLAAKIYNDMPSELYVIKPKGEFLGNGVIVVSREDLNNVLKMILVPSSTKNSPYNEKYAYWSHNKDTNFLVEKYYESDYTRYPHLLNGNVSEKNEYHYDATIRFAFILEYDNGVMTYHYLGGYYRNPCKALEEDGTVDEIRQSSNHSQFYTAINDPELIAEINIHMERAMLLLYEVMLNKE